MGVTSTAILVQAVTAGMFVDQGARDSWVNVHGVIADITWVSALVTAIVAFRRVRRIRRRLWVASAVLFVLALAQTGLGHLISDGGMDSLIVPSAVDPYGAPDTLGKVSRSLTAEEGTKQPLARQDRGGADAAEV